MPILSRLFAAALGLIHVIPAVPAQAGDVPPCQTSSGTPGQVFSEMFTIATAPVDFAGVAVDGEQISAIPAAFAGRAAIVAGVTSGGGPSPEGADGRLRFMDASGETLHECSLTAKVFDPSRHPLSSLTAGDCALRVSSGLPDLRPGHLAVLDLPGEMQDVAVMPVTVVDISALSDREIRVTGRSAGVATFLWIDAENQVSVCPLQATPPLTAGTGIDPAQLCRDTAGREVVLAVGETATLATFSAPSSGWAGDQVKVGAEGIAEVSEVDEAARTVRVTAKAPGTTSILLKTAEGMGPQVCEVAVR
jgi:hypothetical protein